MKTMMTPVKKVPQRKAYLQVVVDRDLRRRVKVAAARQGITVGMWLQRAIEESLRTKREEVAA